MNKWTILPLVRHDKDPQFCDIYPSMIKYGPYRRPWPPRCLAQRFVDSQSWRLFIQPMGWLYFFFVDTIDVANDDILSLSLSYTIIICVIIYYHRITIVICVNIYQQTRVEVQMIWGCDLLPGPSFAIAPRRRSWLCWHLSGRFPQRTERTVKTNL